MPPQTKPRSLLIFGGLAVVLPFSAFLYRAPLKRMITEIGTFVFVIRQAPVLCYLAQGMNVEPVHPMANENEPGRRALPDRLVIGPGLYVCNGQTFGIEREGVVRWSLTGRANYQRIVFNHDTLTLIASICWVVSHGNRDDRLTIEQLFDKAKNDKLILTCDRHVEFAQTVLRSCGVASRRIALHANRNRNGYNDGHVMLEVIIDDSGRRLLVDLAANCIFLDEGSELSFDEFVARISSRNVQIRKIADDVSIDPSAFLVMGYNFNMVMEYFKARPLEWYLDMSGSYTIGDWVK